LLDNAGDDADANRKCDVSHLRIIYCRRAL